MHGRDAVAKLHVAGRTVGDTAATLIHVADVMVGDRRTDLQAGAGYGARSFWVKRDRGLQTILSRLLNPNDIGDEVA